MYDIDVYGSKAIVAFIEQSKHTKFNITKAGAVKQTAPVFQCHGNSNQEAAKEFSRWAEIMQQGGTNNNAYELFLFTNYSDTTKTKEGKLPVKIIFCLLASDGNKKIAGPEEKHQGEKIDAQSITTLITLSIEKALATREESEVCRRLRELEERLDEEEEALGATQQPSELMQILGALGASGALLGSDTPRAAKVAVNGTAEDGKLKLQRINTAIQRLHKIDPDIDSDLLKLADIGEKNPDQFKFLLNALRGM
jgi:hypothetical protein